MVEGVPALGQVWLVLGDSRSKLYWQVMVRSPCLPACPPAVSTNPWPLVTIHTQGLTAPASAQPLSPASDLSYCPTAHARPNPEACPVQRERMSKNK